MSMIRFSQIVGRTGEGPVPDGYDGFHWSNFAVAGDLDPAIGPASGFLDDLYKNHYVAYNQGGLDATMSRATPFALKSAFLAGGWNDQLMVTVTGYLHGHEVASERIGIDARQNLITFGSPFSNVDTVTFHSEGGVHHAGFTGSGTEFAIEDIIWG